MKKWQYVQSVGRSNYLRFKKQPIIKLIGELGSAEFKASYAVAIAAARAADTPRTPPTNPRKGRKAAEQRSFEAKKNGVTNTKPRNPIRDTVRDAVTDYFSRKSFAGLAPKTQADRRYILGKWVEGDKKKGLRGYGDDLIREVNLDSLEMMLDIWIEDRGRGAARNWLSAVRSVLDDRRRAQAIKANPALSLKMPRQTGKPSKGFLPWNPELLAMYRDYWPSGTPQRLAAEALYCTGAACVDAIRLTRSDIKHGLFEFKRQKTGVDAFPACSPALTAEVAACGMEGSVGVLIRTTRGKPFTSAMHFSVTFARWAQQAGLPAGYSAHGIRKLAATDDAFNGWTHTQLMAKYGWARSGQADPYIEEAARRMAVRGAQENAARTVA